jgi:ribosomal protein L10
MLVKLRKYKTLKFLNQSTSFIILKVLPLNQVGFIKLKNILQKYNIQIKVAKTKEVKALLEKIHLKEVYKNQFNLQLHGQVYILKSKNNNTCLLNNFYDFHKNEHEYNLWNNKKFIILSIFYKNFFYKITTLQKILKKQDFIKTDSEIIRVIKTPLAGLFIYKLFFFKLLILIKLIKRLN